MTKKPFHERWPEIKRLAPFHAHMPEGSNGYVYVRAASGEEIATCYGDGAAYATAIANALNLAIEGTAPVAEGGEEAAK